MRDEAIVPRHGDNHRGDGRISLWVRSLTNGATRQIPKTDGADAPFWSPDSRYLGFFSSGKLRKIDANGGPPQALCDAADGRGGAWSSEGTILFTPTTRDPILRVSSAGGTTTAATALDGAYFVHAADLDGDLLPELYFANDFGPDTLLHNTSTPGQLRFAPLHGRRGFTTPRSKVIGRDSFKGMGVDFADLNRDGLADIFVSNIASPFALQESHFVFVSTGDTRAMQAGRAPFVDRSDPLGLARSGWGWDIKADDFDNDGCCNVVCAPRMSPSWYCTLTSRARASRLARCRTAARSIRALCTSCSPCAAISSASGFPAVDDFLLNTLAEVVRSRLRKKYSSL